MTSSRQDQGFEYRDLVRRNIYLGIIFLLAPLAGLIVFQHNWSLTIFLVPVLAVACVNYREIAPPRSRQLAHHTFSVLSAILVIYVTWKYNIIGLLWVYPLILCHVLLGKGRSGFYLASVFILATGLVCMDIFSRQTAMLIMASLGLTLWLSILLEQSLEKLQLRLERANTTDPLTGCSNRSALQEAIQQSIHLYTRYQITSTLIVLSVDNFKSINQKKGAVTGDSLLKEVANVLKSRLRITDMLFRSSGKEFISLLPNTRLEDALKLAEDLQKSILAYDFHGNVKLFISAGLAEISGEEDTDWLERANQQHDRAKKQDSHGIEPRLRP